MMLRNCWAFWSRDCAVTVASSIWFAGCGIPPISPAATSIFWFWIAVTTSAGLSWKLCSLPGSSQIRIAYFEPNTLTSPTPGTRDSSSWILVASQSDTSTFVVRSVSSYTPTIIRKSGDPLVTVMPCCCTCCGSRAIACWTLFWTWTWATSGLTLLSNTAEIETWPRELDDELK